ncbi:MAG: 30S ribosomal protein S18 [Candidatus Colwellbacteria bacterium RIFCSPLOWO2_12_FULL_44_13]|uniref:Small ribosomal subunit protein bS18 n=1 Tax=Candidatus Colwellbacteria bacterium RIFCSPLOWO2_12_FULL_44_13 TaxID=1797694 RepID=A0A1G1ZBX0_9BACT|nr:MAG: 30S ribosomal protein S18 [Candidatus Colwellbacteria bacterium RIFCSPLOWO2_12_FULL_44_13]
MKNKTTQQCFFCSQNIDEIDYKAVDLLKRFTSSQAKIIDPQHTGTCAKHERRLAEAVKRARFLGLLPFVQK